MSFRIEDLRIGNKLIVHYYPGNINNQIYYVGGFVDRLVVVRVWSKRRQNCQYSFFSKYELDLNRENIKLVKHKKGDSHDSSRRSA